MDNETENFKTTRLAAAKGDVHRQLRLLEQAKLELSRREECLKDAREFLLFCEEEMGLPA